MKGWLNKSVNIVDVTFLNQIGRDTSVHAQIIPINVSRNRKSFKWFDKKFINFFLELLEDLTTESEVLCHSTAFMITTQHDYSFRIVQLPTINLIFKNLLTFRE